MLRLVLEPGCGAVWLAHLLWEQRVAGSNPVTPIFLAASLRTRAMTRTLAIVLLVLFFPPQLLLAADAGQIVGELADTAGHITYAGEAVVFLCDQQSGYPIDRNTKKPVEFTQHDSAVERFWYETTKPRKGFEFEDVPVGNYRLVAQSWSGTAGLPKFPGNTSTTVVLHGVAEHVMVKAGDRTVVYPKQLGGGVLRIKTDPEEGHALLLVTLNPTMGDAIVGPLGWGDQFVRNVVGVTHMEAPHVTIVGLPDDRDVHAALLNYDNNPGLGAGSFEAGQREGRLRIVASWSNGHHEPPPELKALTEHLEANRITLQDFVGADLKTNRAAMWRKLVADLRENLVRQVEVRGFGKQRLVDVVAAARYVELRAKFRKKPSSDAGDAESARADQEPASK